MYQVNIRPMQGREPGTIEVEMRSGTDTNISMTEMPPPYDASVAPLQAYGGPVVIDSDRELHGWLQREGLTGPIAKRRFIFNKATARPITLSVQPNERYNEGGGFTLVDGITAQEKRVNTEWLGWKQGVTITVDLGGVQDIRSIGIGALHETYSWIHAPKAIEFHVSTDGKTFSSLGKAAPKATTGRIQFGIKKAGKARYVRLNVQHRGPIPEGLPGAGSAAWMFLDEIEVR
jgi:hexosaminidase